MKTRLFTKRAVCLLRRTIAVFLVVSFVFGDLGAYIDIPFVPSVNEAKAATYQAIKVESFDQDVTTDGSTFTLSNDVGATSSAFIKINTGTRKSSAGPTGSTANTGPDVGTVGLVLTDTSEVTVKRVNATAVKVMGEVWRYEGPAGGGNEFIVRDRVAVSLTGASQSTAISGVSNVDKVVPFITGYTVNDSAVGSWNAATIAAHMDDAGNLVVSRNNSGTAATVYVDVVEFTGSEWTVCHGYSGSHDGVVETVTLNTDSDGQGGSTCDVGDWGTATIIEATMEGDSAETGLSDTLALVRPGSGTTQVDFDLIKDTNARNDGAAWVHVLQNNALVVSRNSDTDIAEGNGSYGTASWPTGATSTASLDLLALEWFPDTSGVGTAHMRGGLHARITDPAGTIQHWIHRSGNTVGVDYGVVELSGLVGITYDVFVSATGTQITSVSAPNSNVYSGGGFVITDETGSRNVTSITITESGTIDAQNALNNIKLYYDLDTSLPYDCASESFGGSESQFGSTDTNGFSGANGVSSFTDSVTISTTQTMCVYAVYDVTASASDGETIDLSIADPSVDIVTVGTPDIGPPTSVVINGNTTISNPGLTQIHYNWREDDGNETGASSVDGIEDTPAGGFQAGTPRRLRIEVSAEGSAASPDVQYRLQYGEKSGTCAAVSTWIDVAETGGAWDTFDSTFVTNGGSTSDIAEGIGGVTNEEASQYTTGAQIDGGDKSQSIALADNEFVELEYTIVPTAAAVDGTTYCFRVADESPNVTHGYRIPLTIQSSEVASTLTDFPVYVDLATLGSHFFANVRSDGGDIRVTTSDGSTEVAREVVSINTGSETGQLYFRAPSISSSADTIFYIYYGANSELEYQTDSIYGTNGVWDGNYAAVYHLEDSGATYIDSTRNGNDGVGEATDPSLATGKLGGAQSFGANGRIDIGNGMNADLISAGQYYISTWLNLNTSSGDQSPVAQYVGAGDFLFWADTGGAGTGFCHYNGSYLPSDCQDLNNQNVGNWQYVVSYHTGAAAGIYLDGSETGLGPTTNTIAVDATQRFAIGAANGDSTSRYFNGLIDEVRIATVDFGLDWSAAEFSNQNTPTTFYATSSFETLNNNPESIAYDVYPEGSITSDIVVSSLGSQVTTLDQGATAQYIGGSFVIERAGTNRTLTDITVTETGSVDATDLSNPRLYYDLSADCSTQTYGGVESNIVGSAFTGPNGSTTFSSIGVTLNTTQSFCGYVVFDVGLSASHGETIDIGISDPSVDVIVTGSTVGPSSVISPTGSTTVAGPILTQTHYHWRNDNGDETDTGATSATGGVEDTPVLDIGRNATIRLRTQVSNEGTVSSQAINYRLEYGTKITTCSDIAAWSQVGVGAAFATSASSFISDGNTTDIDLTGSGAMTEENTTFVGTGALRETSSESGTITLSSTEYTELEYAIKATSLSGYETDYCFRVTESGTPLLYYNNYAELTTREKQDFFVQRGTETISGTSLTLVAGVDYVAPSATSAAFVRITDAHMTGAGNDTGSNGQPADDVTAYISDQSDITSSFSISRVGATSNTRVDWEIVEYIGLVGADNEIIVRDVGEVPFAATEFSNPGTVAQGVNDDSDIVVFITGQRNADTGTGNYNDGLFTASWSTTTSQAVFERGDADSAADVSYAVVEFTGNNWKIQRVEHAYTAAGSAETEPITAIGSITKSFVHAQKRVGESLPGIDEGGHHVWLSSVGYVSFELMSTADTPADHTSVAWVIENTQNGDGSLVARRYSDFLDQPGAAEPLTTSYPIGATVNTSNASIWGTSYSAGTGTTYPRLHAGYRIASSTHWEFWQSDTNNDHYLRATVIVWPVAQLAFEQNYYRFYVDNDSITPSDPWPVGATDLGENTSVTTTDEPLGEGERIRIRMSLKVNNALWPELTKSFKLQYGRRDTTCSAISAWSDVGAAGSGVIWRGYDGTPVDGTAIDPGGLLISVSDFGGTYEEENDSSVNPVTADVGDDVEFDWTVEHNGAVQRSDYCFRMVNSDDTPLVTYNNYPTVRTTGYTPVIEDWRWYNDENNETPVDPLAATNTAPVDIANQEVVKLRVVAKEVESAIGDNVKFGLQYSQYADFSDGGTFLTSTSTCTASSTWCYADGAGVDNQTITTSLISTADPCVAGVGDGCGTHNEILNSASSLIQKSLSSMEFEYTLKQANARVNGVYYFRLYDINNGDPIGAISSYPSLVTEGAQLTLGVAGLSSGTVTEGVTTDADTSATSIDFGTLLIGTEFEVAQRITVNTNATQGYRILNYTAQPFTNSYAEEIPGVSGSNLSPTAWSTGCMNTAIGCVGYHVGDDTLGDGIATRFAPNDTYAALNTEPQEIMYSSLPANESSDIVYKVEVSGEQPAGDYEADIVYLAVPVF